MKLLVITAIISFEKEIKKMLKKVNVLSYSYKKVIGYQDISEESVNNNWFATEINETESILFFAFVKKENSDNLFELVNAFNAKEETQSKVHVAVLNIEKSN
jgi:trimethylamine:corrinoid methyltransferase-like protein